MRYLPRYNIFILLLFFISGAACSSYREIVISSKIILPPEISGYKITGRAEETRPAFKAGLEKSILISEKKFLAGRNGFNPESKIINAGINEALQGNYTEAEILFEEILMYVTDGSIENNLAVIYEITNRKKDAMLMYTKALIKSPENPKFRSNLLSFINHNKFKVETK